MLELDVIVFPFYLGGLYRLYIFLDFFLAAFSNMWMRFALVIFILLVPFKGKFKKSPLKIVATMFLIFVVFLSILATIVMLMDNYSQDVKVAIGMGAVFLVCLFLYYRKIIDDGVNKLLFVFFVAIQTIHFVDVSFVILSNFGIRPDNILVHFLYIAFAMPLIWLVCRALAPRFRQIDLRHMKGLWLIPLMFFIFDFWLLESGGLYSYGETPGLYSAIVYTVGPFILYTLLIFILSNLAKNTAV